MLRALVYLQVQSLANRWRTRLRRLKQPKYLVGALVGAAYFYFYFVRFLLGFGGNPRAGLAAPPFWTPENLPLLEQAAALALLAYVLLAWLLPKERAALVFTEAEIAFLFPAPVSRRTLIHYKLIRSQLAILVSTGLLTLFLRRSGGQALSHAAGWWVLLSTLSLHNLGASFARTTLLDRGLTPWRRRGIILVLVALAAGGVIAWVRRTLPEFSLANLDEPEVLRVFAEQVFNSGPLLWLLLPFGVVVAPYFATGGWALLQALGPALLLLAVHYVWVVRANVAFEEASVEASQKLAERIAAVRAGHWQAASKPRKPRRDPFRLHPAGAPMIGLLWKNLIAAGAAFSPRTWFLLVAMVVPLTLMLGNVSRTQTVPVVIGSVASFLAVYSLMLGPQLLRHDLRQDLHQADLLKLLPLAGWQLVLGELLAPIAILTAIQWLLVLVGAVAFAQVEAPKAPPGLVPSLALGVAFLVAPLNALALLIPNAAVLWFPAWFQTGKETVQGIEVMGQRLVMLFGQVLAFTLSLLPAGLAFAVVFFAVKYFANLTLAVPPAALAAALVLAAEAALGIWLLGIQFAKFDLSAEQGP